MKTDHPESVMGSLLSKLKSILRLRRTDDSMVGRSGDASSSVAANELLSLRRALDEIDDGVVLLDRDLRVEFINRASCEFGGIRRPLVGGKPAFSDLLREIHTARTYTALPDGFDAFATQRIEAVRTGDTQPVELRLANGKIIRTKCTKLPDGGRLLSQSDVTNFVRRNEELAALHAAFDRIDDGVIMLDHELRVKFMNRASGQLGTAKVPAEGERPYFADLLRRARGHIPGQESSKEIEAYVAKRVEFVRSGDPTPIELHLSGGKIVRFKCTVLPDGGRLLNYTDVTDLVRHNEELETLRAALDKVAVGVMLLDHELRAQFINRAFRRMSKMPDEMADRRPTFTEILEHGRATRAFAVDDNDIDAYITARIEMVRTGDSKPVEIRWSGERVVRFQITPLPGGGRMLTYTDISDLVRTADQLEKLAVTDGLTGQYNRRHFIALAEREWERFRRYRRSLSMLLLDIDFFKAVNDRFGHDVGDQMIVHVANLCQENKRSSDVVARVGGEEFAILLPETEMESACLVAERLRRVIAAKPLVTAGILIPVTISVGVAEANTMMKGILDLMKLADRLLYEAKRGGRNRVVSPRNSDSEAARPYSALATFGD